MFKLFREEFDSRLFGKNVYKLYLEKTLKNKKSVIAKIKKLPVDVVFCFTVFDNQNIEILEKLGFNLVSIRNTYQLSSKYKYKNISMPKFFKFSHSDQVKSKLNSNDIDKFIRILLQTSRYSKDRRISRKIGEKIYLTWINNSFYNKYADKCIFALSGDKAVGFITVKVKEGVGFIDLIAVLKPHQNKGLGSVLLNKAFNYLKSRGIDKIYVVTEGENTAANAFYQRNQFVLQKTELVYHKHNN
ncbi:GNAT family N-acetyltransferase [Candidatus Roizmanbacteria bacterium]|nr:GNAT family N-acetyltransferase [Candidatus Roizmanbacteria bacterium]